MTSGHGVKREAFFLNPPDRRLFAAATYPTGPAIGGLLYLPPFAEEMNKCRRMASLAAQSFAEHGWLVLQVDLTGCGDSSGDFGDADWALWLDDIDHAWTWLSERCAAPLSLWTLRAGSLLAADWLARRHASPPLIVWQPVSSGEQHLIQFLRLKAANEMLGAAENRGIVAGLREDIDAGVAVEVAGYRVAAGLAKGLQAARLRLPNEYPAAVSILEVAYGERHEPSRQTATLADTWSQAGVATSARVVRGPSFWQTLEIDTAPELIPASLEALGGSSI